MTPRLPPRAAGPARLAFLALLLVGSAGCAATPEEPADDGSHDMTTGTTRPRGLDCKSDLEPPLLGGIRQGEHASFVQMVGDLDGIVGHEVVLAARIMDRGTVVEAERATATLAGQHLTLRDEGNPPDAFAADGIYSASHVFLQAGAYPVTVSMRALGTTCEWRGQVGVYTFFGEWGLSCGEVLLAGASATLDTLLTYDYENTMRCFPALPQETPDGGRWNATTLRAEVARTEDTCRQLVLPVSWVQADARTMVAAALGLDQADLPSPSDQAPFATHLGRVVWEGPRATHFLALSPGANVTADVRPLSRHDSAAVAEAEAFLRSTLGMPAEAAASVALRAINRADDGPIDTGVGVEAASPWLRAAAAANGTSAGWEFRWVWGRAHLPVVRAGNATQWWDGHFEVYADGWAGGFLQRFSSDGTVHGNVTEDQVAPLADAAFAARGLPAPSLAQLGLGEPVERSCTETGEPRPLHWGHNR